VNVKALMETAREWRRRMAGHVYLDWNDQWVGRYRSDTHNYVCPLPCLVIRWRRS
jgi:hypothetical protein